MKEAAHRRLLRGIFAFLGSAAMRIAVQLLMLPLLFANWEIERVGGWLALFALPAYFAVVGQAFSGAGGNVTLAASQAGQWEEARAAMRSSWLATMVGTLGLVTSLLLPALLFNRQLGSMIGPVSGPELAETLGWLALYVIAAAQSGVSGVAYRVAGNYPQFIFANSAAMFFEVAVLAACVSASESYAVLAAGLALWRLAFAGMQAIHARRTVPQLYRGKHMAIRPMFRRLWRPSLAFLVLPVVYALNLQGYTLLVGAAYGAAMVATFVATRTIIRLIDLATNVLFGLQFMEAGYLGANKRAIQQRQLATMTLVTIGLSLGLALALLFLGPWLQALFTNGKSEFDPVLGAILVASSIVRAASVTPQALISSENRHGAVVKTYVAWSLASFTAALLLALNGAPIVLALALLIPAELAQTIPSLHVALRQLGMSRAAFLRSLVSRERIEDFTALWNFLRARSRQ